MADYIFIRKSRNAVSSLLHIILNLLLAVVSIGATVITGNVIIGLIIVFISKWRIFAVNHRYWLLNLRSSLVDLIVGVSFVLLTYAATVYLADSANLHQLLFEGITYLILIITYAIWLIFIKPRSSTLATISQAIIAILLGTTTASIFATVTDSSVLVAASFLIGFAASHHVLVQSDDKDAGFISLVCGLIFAEIAWLSYSWLIIYIIPPLGICFSQLSLVLAVLAFAYFEIHREISQHRGKLKFANVALPVLFSLLVLLVLMIAFSNPSFNI